MADARYEILIPQGNFATHALNHLVSKLQVTTAYIEPREVYNMGSIQNYDVLAFVVEDAPKTDSTAKQIAAYVGDAANVPLVLVSKQGKQGIQTWPVRNHKYVDIAEGG